METESRTINQSPQRGVHRGVAGFFRAGCHEARRGGNRSYYAPGYSLATALGSQSPIDIEDNEWSDEVDTLKALLGQDDSDGVWGWFQLHYPRMMELVPSRRRQQFIAGVQAAFEEGNVEL